LTISSSVGLYAEVPAGLCVAAVPAVAREADLWTMVRVALARDGEGTPRSIIWRFAGGGWP
jgi:hypothetical protein